MLCNPAKLYLFVSMFTFMFAIFKNISVLTLFIKFIFICMWTFLLNWMCSKGYEKLAWFVVLFPVILGLLLFLIMMDLYKKKK